MEDKEGRAKRYKQPILPEQKDTNSQSCRSKDANSQSCRAKIQTANPARAKIQTANPAIGVDVPPSPNTYTLLDHPPPGFFLVRNPRGSLSQPPQGKSSSPLCLCGAERLCPCHTMLGLQALPGLPPFQPPLHCTEHWAVQPSPQGSCRAR